MGLNQRGDDEFLKSILNEVDSGYGFVPIIGSGLSAPSGIPTGTEFGEYLFEYLKRILNGEETWDPEHPTWPIMEDGRTTKAQDLSTKLDWIGQQLDNYETRGASLESIAAMADWRAALTFLSRLPKPDKTGAVDLGKLVLGPPAENVVDSSFIHITAGRQPNVGHMMLAHLSDALRIQTILTTNFDSLIEEAFARQGMPLITFDVHQKAGLPSTELVLAQRAVVKLHGGRYGLRADWSLDATPPLEDQKAFASLFRGVADTKARKHMLVMGVSGTDARTMNLIHYAAKETAGLQVHWICHRDDEVATIHSRLPLGNKLKIRVEPDLGLFLFELYQHHYLSLPPAGTYYPSVARVPPGLYRLDAKKCPKPATSAQFGEHKRLLLEAIVGQDHEDTWVTAVGGKKNKSAGVSSVAADVYESLYRDFHCIWLQLDHFADEGALLVALVEAVSQKVGMFSTLPPMPRIDRGSCRQFLSGLIQRSFRPFLIFINGRDGLGKYASWVEASNPWTASQQKGFWRTIRFLANKNLRFVVLYGNGSLEPPDQSPKISNLEWSTASIDIRVKELIGLVEKYVGSKNTEACWKKARFIYALTLFRHSCHPSALSTWGLMKAPVRLAVGQDNDQARAKEYQKMIRWLAGNGLIRHQRGGTVWMHSDVAAEVRKFLEKQVFAVQKRLRNERAACHQGIADWYVKLFRSSNDPLAALESLYHRLCCLKYADKKNDPFDFRHTSVLEAIETLKLARTRILSCGYVKTSSNLMKQIQKQSTSLPKPDSDILPLATKLKCLCLELLRDFSREAADFNGASTYTNLLANEPPDHETLDDAELVKTLAKLQSSVLHAENLTGLREYDAAEAEFQEVFREMGIRVCGHHLQFDKFQRPSQEPTIASTDRERDLGAFILDVRQSAAEWWKAKRRSSDELKLAITSLRKYMFLQMLIGQAHSLAGSRSDIRARTKRWQFAEAVYTAATTMMRYVEDHEFLQIENTYIRTHYGVLMSCMGRYHEAHRRLNEASGYLSQSTRATDGLIWAVIDLRRAETYLRQAEDKIHCIVASPTGDNDVDSREKHSRSAAAFLEDARFALDRVEHRFVDQRKEIWWWTLRYELQLWFYVAQAKLYRVSSVNQPKDPGVNRAHGPLSQLDIRRCTRLVFETREFLQSEIVRHARLAEQLYVLASYTQNSDLIRLHRDVHKSLAASIDRSKVQPTLRRYVNRVLKRKPK